MRSSEYEARRFADYFAVCGLDPSSGLEPDLLTGDSLGVEPLQRPYKAKVLHHYPDNVTGNPFEKDGVHMLCFPKGLSFTLSNAVRNRTRFHPFLITRVDGSRVYGAACTFYEEVTDRNVCEAMATLQQMHNVELAARGSTELGDGSGIGGGSRRHGGGRGSRSGTTTYDPAHDRLLVTKCICVVMQKPFYRAAEQWLTQLHATAMVASRPAGSPVAASPNVVPLECHVYNLLFEVPEPGPGCSVTFMAGRSRVICQQPGCTELPLLDLPFEEVFGLLGVDNVISVLLCMLLEQRIMLYSSDYYRLMLVAECLSTALFPFAWQHAYVPILPASLRHFLDAPVPFVMGLHCPSDEDAAELEQPSCELCAVDIDGQKVELPEELPRFPCHQELADELASMLRQYGVAASVGSKTNLYLDADSVDSLHVGSCKDDSEGDDSGMNSHDESAIGEAQPSSQQPAADGSGASAALCPFDVLHESEAMARVAEIAKKSGVIRSLEDFKQQFAHDRRRLDEQKLVDSRERQRQQKELSRLKFSTAVREVLFSRLLFMFAGYEKYVIPPGSDMTKDQWLHNRELMQNFDKKAFLCDQPDVYLPFICPFIETQMFATFIDNKILSQWDEPDASIRVFDQRLAALGQRLRTAAPATAGDRVSGGGVMEDSGAQGLTQTNYQRCTTCGEAEVFIEKRAERVDLVADSPHILEPPALNVPPLAAAAWGELAPAQAPTSSADALFFFPRLLSNVSRNPLSGSGRLAESSKPNDHQKLSRLPSLRVPLQPPQPSQTGKEALARTQSKMYNPHAIDETNHNFVTGLLMEIKAKTSKMVVNKMGLEAAALGHNLVLGLEESTLIASLCDLLERVWSHGLQHKQGKSPMWAHLMTFAEQADAVADRSRRVSKFKAVAPTQPGSGLADLQGLFVDTSEASAGKGKPAGHARRSSHGGDSSRTRCFLEPLPSGLMFDLNHVRRMTEIKTDVGKARAWIRLCLEKRVLAKHMRELLSDKTLRKHMYRSYALLRQEEEREQMLLHVLSLSTADFFCFTNTFTNTVVSYRVLILPGRRFPSGQSSTSANVWVSLSGHLLESARLWIPKNCLEFIYEGKNLGMLTTLRIGHDSSGLSPRWLLDCVIVRNEMTGHVYRFPCGRWLGRGVDDDSTERILVGEIIAADTVCEPNVAALSLETAPSSNPSASTGVVNSAATAAARRSAVSPKLSRVANERSRRVMSKGDIEQSLLDAVNGLVKYFWKPEKERGSVTVLLCADGGLVACLEAAFQYGFKASRLFRNNYYVWDYVEKVLAFLCDNDKADEYLSFRNRVQAIDGSSQNVGKDGKFQLLMCLGVRDHCLGEWLHMLSMCSVTQQMFDDHSFIRDCRGVRTVVNALTTLDEFDVALDPSLTKGLPSFPCEQPVSKIGSGSIGGGSSSSNSGTAASLRHQRAASVATP